MNKAFNYIVLVKPLLEYVDRDPVINTVLDDLYDISEIYWGVNDELG